MAQDFEQIGQESPELARVAAEHQGWEDAGPAQDLGREITDASDFSFYDRRANKQALGWSAGLGSFTIPASMEAHTEPSMAAIDVVPPARGPEPADKDAGAGALAPYGGSR